MEGRRHGPAGRVMGAALAAILMPATLPPAGVAAAGPAELIPLPDCAALPASSPDVDISSPWQVVLDDAGVVIGHRMTLRRGANAISLRVGRRGFAVPVSADRLLVGERMSSGTSLTMLDTRRGCRTWARSLDALAYEATASRTRRLLRLDVVDPLTRFFEGQPLLDVDSGATVALIDGECSNACQPNDGDLAPADFQPAGAPRPVPAFAAGGWPRDTTLPFGWLSGDAATGLGTLPGRQRSRGRLGDVGLAQPGRSSTGAAPRTPSATRPSSRPSAASASPAPRGTCPPLGGLAASPRHGLQLGHPALVPARGLGGLLRPAPRRHPRARPRRRPRPPLQRGLQPGCGGDRDARHHAGAAQPRQQPPRVRPLRRGHPPGAL